MSIELHIERLVIDEALLGDERPHSVGRALQRELAQWLAQPTAADALHGLGTVAGLPATTLPPATPPRQTLGPRIATALQQGLGACAATHTASRKY